MFRSIVRALAARKPAQRKSVSTRARLGTTDDWLLEARDCPAVVNFTIEPVSDAHLSPSQHQVPVLQFTAKGTDWRSALSTLVVDDAKQGALNFVRSATLYYESGPGNWTPLDSSPVSTAAGKRIGFNGFGWVPVGDLDGARFQVRVDTIDAAFTPVHGELDIVAANVRYGGTPTFSGITSPGNNQEEFPVATNGGPQRTIYHIVDLSEAQKTVNANSRDQTVMDLYVNASDPRAYANCMRFITKDATALPFVKTATFYREISPGNWHAMMTVRPDGYGRLIFTVYTVHQQFRTSGLVHLQVRVNTDPAMVGSRKVDLAWYYSTSPYAGQKSWDVLELNAPQPPVTHGMLSTSSLFYPSSNTVNTRVADINVGVGPNAYFNRLELHVATGTFTGTTGFRLYRADSSGNPINQFPLLGHVTYNDGNTVVIDDIGWTIDAPSNGFVLFADGVNPFQIGSVVANG